MVRYEDSIIATLKMREKDTGLKWSWREKEKTRGYRRQETGKRLQGPPEPQNAVIQRPKLTQGKEE